MIEIGDNLSLVIVIGLIIICPCIVSIVKAIKGRDDE